MSNLVNKRVLISGLRSRSDLNGKHGRVLGFDSVRNRYNVQIEDRSNNSRSINNILALKEENLILNYSNASSNQSSYMHGFSPGNAVDFITKSLGNTFVEENIGLASITFLVTSFFVSRLAYVTLLCLWICFAIECFNEAQKRGWISRSTNILGTLKEKFRSLEFAFALKLTSIMGSPVRSSTALLFITGAITFYRFYLRKTTDYFFDDEYDEYSDYSGGGYGYGSGSPLNLGGISIISLLFLGVMLWKLDIPRNGLGALRNLNFFEIMYLYNILQQIFGGNQHRRSRGYGGSPYGGYGGYGGGYRRRRYW